MFRNKNNEYDEKEDKSMKKWTIASIGATILGGLIGAFGILAEYKSGKENESELDARLEEKYGLVPIETEETPEE